MSIASFPPGFFMSTSAEDMIAVKIETKRSPASRRIAKRPTNIRDVSISVLFRCWTPASVRARATSSIIG
jgi:hypothetical protein